MTYLKYAFQYIYKVGEVPELALSADIDVKMRLQSTNFSLSFDLKIVKNENKFDPDEPATYLMGQSRRGVRKPSTSDLS